MSLALFTLNFLNIDAHGHTAAERHCSEPDRPNEMVKWKNVLDNKWYGPDPILIRSRGAICVFPQNEDNPFWLPERLTEKSRLTKGILMSLVLVMSRASIIKREQRWGIMSTFPLPMTVMYNAQVFSCFFTTN